jgi:hypothetical protein
VGPRGGLQVLKEKKPFSRAKWALMMFFSYCDGDFFQVYTGVCAVAVGKTEEPQS